MQKFQDIVLRSDGRPAVGAAVTVTTSSGAAATLYSGNGTGQLSSNIVRTDSTGEYSFYAANGRYNIAISYGGYTSETKSDVVLFDMEDDEEIGTVAANIGSVINASNNMAAIQAAPGKASEAATSASNASTAAGQAQGYADAASESANAAAQSAANAASGMTDLANQADAAKGSALVGFVPAGTGAVGRSMRDKLREVVSVKDFGAKGDGVTDDTAALAAARAAVAAGGVELVFPAGTYVYTASPNWAIPGLRLRGDGKVVLQFNGSGVAWNIDAGTGDAFGLRMDNFIIRGNTNATDGVYTKAVHHSVFRNIDVFDVSVAGFRLVYNVCNVFDTCRVTSNPGPAFNPMPTRGIIMEKRGAAEQCSANTIINPVVERVTGIGIHLVAGIQNAIIGGTSEGIIGQGLVLEAESERNTVHGLDLEGNTGEDLVCASSFNSFVGLLSAGITWVRAGAKMNTFTGGVYDVISIDTGAVATTLDVAYASNGGALTDNGTDTRIERLYSLDTARMAQAPFSARESVPPTPWAGIGVPDRQDLVSGSYSFTTAPSIISSTTLTAGTPWRAVFMGVWLNNYEAYGLAQPAPFIEVTSASPTIQIGGTTVLTVSVNGSGKLQAVTSEGTITFSGRVFVMSNNLGAAGSDSAVFKDRVSVGSLRSSGAIRPGTPAGTVQVGALFMGDGVPSNAHGSDGDFYLRRDGGTGTAFYQKRGGTWASIL